MTVSAPPSTKPNDLNDGIGTRVLRDPFTSKPFVLFYVTKRVGGGVLDPNAVKLLKIAA